MTRETANAANWQHVSSGKVRDIYRFIPTIPSPLEGQAYLMVTSDRISAYDVVMPTAIPGKGKILNQLAVWWMGQMTDIVPTHLMLDNDGSLLPVPAEFEGRAVVCRALEMLPVECVVRGYLTGSGLVEYKDSGTVCGIELSEGFTEASKLPQPIFTPAAKAELGEHDENVTFERVVEMIGADRAERLRDLSIQVYQRAADIAAERGIILADTKFEFGIDPATGEIVLADEILTPDSSRFWPADQWQPGQVTPSFDKQYLRDWLRSDNCPWDGKSPEAAPELPENVVTATRDRYVEAFTRLTGTEPQL